MEYLRILLCMAPCGLKNSHQQIDDQKKPLDVGNRCYVVDLPGGKNRKSAHGILIALSQHSCVPRDRVNLESTFFLRLSIGNYFPTEVHIGIS